MHGDQAAERTLVALHGASFISKWSAGTRSSTLRPRSAVTKKAGRSIASERARRSASVATVRVSQHAAVDARRVIKPEGSRS